MGILIIQKNKKWRAEIREIWRVDKLNPDDELTKFLLNCKIQHNIEFDDNKIIYKFDGIRAFVELDKLDELKKILEVLLDFKEKYGQLKWMKEN